MRKPHHHRINEWIQKGGCLSKNRNTVEVSVEGHTDENVIKLFPNEQQHEQHKKKHKENKRKKFVEC